MDLLNEKQYQKQETPKGKKTVLALLVISIIAVILIGILMIFLEANKVIPKTLYIGDEIKELPNGFLIGDSAGNQYINLKQLSEFFGYEFDNREYQKYDVDTTKCHIKFNKLISGFEMDSNKMYKYEEGTNLDYQYYTLKHNIIAYNSNLYIAVDDLQQALNIKYITNTNNEIKIYDAKQLANIYQEKLKELGYAIATDQNNQKALAYDFIIANKNGIWSVFDTNYQEVIGGAKYASIYFDECNFNYIVSNTNGQYGIISTTGRVEQSLKYDGLEIINYERMLYKVKNNNKYGVMKKDGTVIGEIIYDDIGYKADSQNKILYTLIVPKMDYLPKESIVIKSNSKYGLMDIETGDELLPCDHLDKLYSVSELGKIHYRIEAEKQTLELNDYLRIRATQVIDV